MLRSLLPKIPGASQVHRPEERVQGPAAADTHHAARDPGLDVLRGVGLCCIVLAHVGPPQFLFQLRNFDVPLMVLVAGAAYSVSGKGQESFARYVKARFVRIVLPTWVFLSIFFAVALGLSSVRQVPLFTPTEVACSYALLDEVDCKNIGYVWIIRVFFLVALSLPWAHKGLDGTTPKARLAILGLVYVAYELAVLTLPMPNAQWLRVLLTEFAFYVVPYSIVAMIGGYLPVMSPRQRALAGALGLLVFFTLLAGFRLTTGGFILSQAYKYPPRLYYFAYAFGVTFTLSAAIGASRLDSTRAGRLLAWLGQRTMWIYLWHIVVLYVLHGLDLHASFAVKLIIVFMAGALLAVMQERAVNLVLPGIADPNVKRTLRTVLTG